jgi:hypothetical protein
VLNPAQHTNEQDQAHNVEDPDPADDLNLALETFHVVHPECNDEEDQVAEQKDEPGCAAVPPRIFPGQRADGVEQVFDERNFNKSRLLF